MIDRRDFLRNASLSAGALAFLDPLLRADLPASTAPQVGNSELLDPSIISFWTEDIRRPSEAFAKNLTLLGGPSYQPAFVYYISPGIFQAQTEIGTDDLPEKGQVNVSLRVERFRPSHGSSALFSKVQSGSLRIDVKQTKPLPDLGEALAWTAVAAFLPKQKNELTDLRDLTFDPGTAWGQLQQIPLTNGLGFWSWNFFLKNEDSFWSRLMNLFRQAEQSVFPFLGMPAIALTALKAVDRLVGYLQAEGQSSWLFKSVDSPIVATKEGLKAVGQGLALKSGHYLIIPQEHLAAFGSARRGLELKDGYLVATGTDAFEWPANAALQIPSVDYLSVYVQATPSKA